MRDPITVEQHDDSRRHAVQDWRGSGTILVVDDEPMVRMVITSVLGSRGFTVLEAGDGREGLRIFREHGEKLRMVLMDLSMPGMNGVEAFGKMHHLNAEIPVVLLSGSVEQDATDLFPGEAPAAFLPKPFRPAALVKLVREVLERGQEV